MCKSSMITISGSIDDGKIHAPHSYQQIGIWPFIKTFYDSPAVLNHEGGETEEIKHRGDWLLFAMTTTYRTEKMNGGRRQDSDDSERYRSVAYANNFEDVFQQGKGNNIAHY